MAPRRLTPITISDLRGGRNGTDPPFALPDSQCVDAVNVDWKDATLANKRGGAIAVSQTGGTAFTLGIQTLHRHVPGGDETLAELWAIDGAATPIVKRLTGGTTWANVTLDKAIQTRPQDVVPVSFNGKLFLAHDSTVDRLHVYDPNLVTPVVRDVGFPTPAAPTAANTGAGTYAAVQRYYRVRWLQVSGTTVYRRSEPSASVSFTPSGTGTHARITQPAVAGENETHWEIEASLDNASFYLLRGFGTDIASGTNTQIAIATTTFDDNEAATQANYDDGDLSHVVGTYARFPSVRYLLTDGNRLLGAGAWESAGAESGGRNSRIWFTPVLGSLDRGDDERMMNTTTQKNWVDLNENDGGFITGLGGPLNGLIYVFKYRQVWRLIPTGDVQVPYLPKKIRDDIGSVSHKMIQIGEDQFGRAALYFVSHKGPYRITMDGAIEYLGRDNEDLWRTINLEATAIIGQSLYYPDLHQWWVWIATGAGQNRPDLKMMFDVYRGMPDTAGMIRGGWAQHTGDTALARCSSLFSNTLGASMSRDLKPHVGLPDTLSSKILKCDTTDLNDDGTTFQAYVLTRPLLTTPDLIQKVGVGEPIVVAKAQAATTVRVTIDRDFAAETRNATADLAAVGTETRVIVKAEGLEMGEANVIQLQIGDAAAVSSAWTLDAVIVPVIPQEVR